jgi:hypothetical protein
LFSDELRELLGAPLRFEVVGADAIDFAITFVDWHRRVPVEHVDTRTETARSVVELHPAKRDIPSPTQASNKRYLGSERSIAHLWPPLGAMLIRDGLVTDTELETALAQQRLSASRRLGEILVDRGVVTTTDVARLVAEQYELPFVELAESGVELEAASLLQEEIAWRCTALPIRFLPDGSLQVAVADPTNVLYSDEVRSALDLPLQFAVAAP